MMDDCMAPDANMTGLACDGRTDFSPVTEPGGDFVEEGYDADGVPSRIHHLFSNVSEFTAGYYQEDVTCKEPLPEGDHPGGALDDWDDCISCDECIDLTGEAKTYCSIECKHCEACAGTYQDGTPYYSEGYPTGPLDCHIGCWGEPAEAPVCVRYSEWDLPLEASAIAGVGTWVTVRGGNVGIIENTNGECRFRADYRDERLAPDGWAGDSFEQATDKGVGFRCARDLTTEEWTTFAADPRFGHLVEGAEETLAFEPPNFTVHVEPADAEVSSDADANDAGPME